MKLNETKELKPLFNYVVVRPININPYVIRKTESGLIIPIAGTAHSQETGQIERLEQRILFGVIVDVGSTCQEAQIGDEIYFDKNSSRPLPVLDLGYLHMHEQNIMSIVRGEGDTIAEALEFEETLRKELAAGAAKQTEESKNQDVKRTLEERGIVTSVKY